MDSWKSLRTQVTTVLAAFPQTPETRLTVHRPTAQTRVTVFHEFFRDGRKYQGSTEFDQSDPDAPSPSAAELNTAIAACEMVEDPWFPVTLAQSTSLPSKTSSLSKQSLEDWVSPIQDLLVETAKGQDFLLQKEFIRLTREEVRYRDSQGRDLSDLRYSGFLEVFLLPADQPDVQPHHAELLFSEFSPSLFKTFLLDHGHLACHTHRVTKWKAPEHEFQVLIRGQAVRMVFDYVLRQLSGLAAYSGKSTVECGKPLWGLSGEGDLLTVEALGLLYDSPDTALFDDQGIVLTRQVLVRDGVVQGLLTSQQTAHWLGLPLTGMNRNISVSPGTADLRALAGKDVLEVHRLRTAEIDSHSGEFQAEVELADYHHAGTVSTVYGVSLKGNLRKALTEAQFSKDIGTWETYEGPEFILVASSLILGGN